MHTVCFFRKFGLFLTLAEIAFQIFVPVYLIDLLRFEQGNN